LLLPLAFFDRTPSLSVALLVAVALSAVRFGDEWASPPRDAPVGPHLTLASWNLELESRAAQQSADWLADHRVDVVALQELTPDVAHAIETDPRLRDAFPYMSLEPRPLVQGLGLLSHYPIARATYLDEPIRQEAILSIGTTDITVVNAHPLPASINRLGPVPVGLDPTLRNQRLDAIKRRVDDLVAAGLPVIVVGDFNTAPTEPAFGRLVDGLVDVHAAVGEGPGWTWRPSRLEFLGIGLLRIDLVLIGPGIAPVSTASSCPAQGDHCLLEATLSIEAR
jgi:endonuclease/exonuclease/phosphatase (EEP) superfamily protein YafD